MRYTHGSVRPIVGVNMKYVYLFFFVILTVSCGGSKINNHGALTGESNASNSNEEVTLIISPQGVDPESDSIGFNQLVKGVTQSFSESLSRQLMSRGVQTLSIIDQNQKLDLGQKILNHTKEHQVHSIIVLTLDVAVEGDDKQLILKVQKAPLEFNEIERTIKIGVVDEKLYVLSGSISGDYKGSMEELADDYIRGIMLN